MVGLREHVKSWVVPKFDYRDASLVLYLPLWYQYSDMAGGTIYSYDRNRHTGTVTGATWGKTGRTFNGTSDKIDCGNATSLNIAGDWTIGCWLYSTATNAYKGLITKSNGSLVKNYNYGLDTGAGTNVWTGVGDGTNKDEIETAAGTCPLNTWTMAFARRDGSTLDIFINGRYSTGMASTLTPATVAVNLELGRDAQSNGNCFTGIIGEVFIYNRALTAGEVMRNYQATKWRY